MAWPSKRTSSCVSGNGLAGGDAELPFDEIEAGDRFGHRMLDLQPRVHLHEPERRPTAVRLCRRRRTRRCRRRHSRPRGPPRPPPRPSARAAARVMPGAGASSITFWWRRCSEQSRSLRWMMLPWRSAKTWTSIWRGAAMYFSISTRPEPNADCALAHARRRAPPRNRHACRRGACRARRRPRPA